MSNFANPADSRLWIDGDAFRAAENTAAPADIFAATLTGWDAYGGIKAGFDVERTQDVTELAIWNKPGTYRLKRGDEKGTITFQATDESKATGLTLLRGGSVSAASGGFKWTTGTTEQFALIVRAIDGTEKVAYYMKSVELSAIPKETLNDDDLMVWEFQITPLVPDDGTEFIQKFTFSNPLV